MYARIRRVGVVLEWEWIVALPIRRSQCKKQIPWLVVFVGMAIDYQACLSG